MNTVAKPITPIRPSTLMEAFIQAQKQIEPNPTFDKKANTGKFSYPYISLGKVLEIIRPPLANNGLSIQQFVEERDGKAFLVTRISHSCGESQDFYIPLYGVSQNPQDFGKAFTYARRYALYGIFGIYGEEDDDANSIKDNGEQQKRALLPKVLAAVGADEALKSKILTHYKVKDFYMMNKEQMEDCLDRLEEKAQEKKDAT